MAINGADLPAYDELIENLAGRLDGLSTVHEGLGETARSLLGAQRELAETKRAIDALAASSEGRLAEVRRLDPAALGASLDTALARAARETPEGLGALSARLLAMGGEAATEREQAEIRSAALDQALAARDEALQQRLSAIEDSFAASLAAARESLTEAVATSQRTTQGALAGVRERQERLLTTLVDVERRQEDLAERHEALLRLLIELRRQQVDLAERVAGVRDMADGTRATALTIQRSSEAMGPSLREAIAEVRTDLRTELARARREQTVSLVVLLVALLLAVAAAVAVRAGMVPLA